MIRVVLFLVSLALVAAGVAWFADRPGDIAITWLGYRIETSLMVAAIALILLILAIIFLWSIVRGIWRSPDQVSVFMRHRRSVRGHLAISRGLIAIGAGDAATARKSAHDAAKLAGDEPLTLLLAAQSAQLSGDRVAAERAFRAMMARKDTKLLGLRGLYVEAQRRNDANAARLFAEEAAIAAPALSWAAQAALDHRVAANDWGAALEALERMKSSLGKDAYRRQRAVLLTARALALEDTDSDVARALALEAAKLAPDLVPAAALAGRLLSNAGELRKASKILDRAWKAHPHPDLAEAYVHLRFGDSARDRLIRAQKLAEKTPGNIEGALAVAHAAIDTRQFAVARGALAPHLPSPTRRVATLMSEIEEMEGDKGRAREWMARAMRAAPDPAWTAEGLIAERWMPVSPSGRLDAFQWKVPLAEIGFERPAIEAELPPSVVVPAAPAEIEVPPPEPRRATPPPAAKPAKRAAEPVIPLVHAPDDPGPDFGIESDPIPTATAPLPPDPWQRLRQLFR